MAESQTEPARNLTFKIVSKNCKVSVDQMLKDIVEKQRHYEKLSKKAKDMCQDHFAQSMAANFVMLSNKVEWAKTDSTDSTRAVLEKYFQSSASPDNTTPSVEEIEYINVLKALNSSIYGTSDDDPTKWKKLRETGLLTVPVICSLHEELMVGLKSCEDGGKIRKRENGRGDVLTEYGGEIHHYPPPEGLEEKFYAIIDRHNIHVTDVEKSEISLEKTSHVFKCATWLLFKVVSLHPFFNGNGRVCRILANYILSLIIPFPIPIYITNSADRNREHYLDAIVLGRSCPDEGMGLLASMLVEGAYIGWSDLFQYLEAGGLVGSKQLIGPIVVQKSRTDQIKEKVERLKDISDVESLVAAVQEAVDSADTSSLKMSDQHICKEIELECGVLLIEIYS